MRLGIIIFVFLYLVEIYSITKQLHLYKNNKEGLYYFKKNKLLNTTLLILTILFTIVFPTLLLLDYITFFSEYHIRVHTRLLALIFYFLWGIQAIIQHFVKDMLSEVGIYINTKLFKWDNVNSFRWYEIDPISLNSKKYKGLYVYVYRSKLGRLIFEDNLKELELKIPNDDINNVNIILEKYKKNDS